ncbi:hypothetical protein [Salicibibacter kimchii]|uniref:Uncharacterized protein n=1 Tax=Salicibibacter kimchii TaxID=2099786 RepID=A0A345BW23_9BACI|nr:hypothetical protein [Salicibibacter kimchii]AXF55154.1 hypothetical protein DT065_03395 [Salicibibacter kimchii]
MAKKLEGTEAIKDVLNENEDMVIDIKGKKFLIHPIKKNEVQKEIENNTELQKMIERADQDIAAGNVFTTEEMLESIRRGEI